MRPTPVHSNSSPSLPSNGMAFGTPPPDRGEPASRSRLRQRPKIPVLAIVVLTFVGASALLASSSIALADFVVPSDDVVRRVILRAQPTTASTDLGGLRP